MKDVFFEEHWLDANGNPGGGVSSGKGMCLSWQNGPLGTGDARKEPNGCFVETVIQAVIGRIKFYQASQFACDENAGALVALERAAEWLDSRTKERTARQVEGTHAL
ncbi:MAG TPA: hypothetical protein VI542_12315 [Candidatus Tectomicrobia bacterium]